MTTDVSADDTTHPDTADPDSRDPDTMDVAADPVVANLPRRFLRSFLLLALASVGTAHGYELWDAVRARRLAVDLAGVYRALRSMEQHDLVTSCWEPSDAGPDRRVYELTANGRSAAAAAARDLQEIRDGLSSALHSFSTAVVRP